MLEKADNPHKFTKGLEELLKSFVDKEATKNYQRIIPDTGKFYGVPFPILRVVAAEIGTYVQKKPAKARLFLSTIWHEGSFEARKITGKSLEKFGAKNPKICIDFVSSILNDLDNWANCDNLAMFGVEPIVCNNPEFILPLSEKWIKDKNKWIRRFGIVTLRGYNRVQTTDKVFRIFDPVMEDKNKDIKKAVSWILREVTKKNPDEVGKFLTKWAKKDSSKETKWIIKDGIKKMTDKKQKQILALLDCQR